MAIRLAVPYAPPLIMLRGVVPWLVGLAALISIGCQNNIGDGCGSSTDCSITGDRQCDLSQPGGYCTVFACDPDTCPEGACVEWRFNPSRTAQTWCMQTCNGDGDCRAEYWCVSPDRITPTGDRVPESGPPLPPAERIARIIDLEGNRAASKVCAARPPPRGLGEACQINAECDPNATNLGAFCCNDEALCGPNVNQCVANCSTFSSGGIVQEVEDATCQDNSECGEGLFCCLVPDAAGNCDFDEGQACTCRGLP